MEDFEESAFNGLRMTLEEMREMENDEDENAQTQIGGVGTLFNSFRARNRRPSRTRTRGNHPSRTFVFLGRHDPNEIAELSNCQNKKIKFPSTSTPEEIKALLSREFTAVGTSSRILYYKSRSSGNHALHRVGEHLHGKQIVVHFKYAATKVYIGVRAAVAPTSTTTRPPMSTPTRATTLVTSTPTDTVAEISTSTPTPLPAFTTSTVTSTITSASITIPSFASRDIGLTFVPDTNVPNINLDDSDDDLLISAIRTPPQDEEIEVEYVEGTKQEKHFRKIDICVN